MLLLDCVWNLQSLGCFSSFFQQSVAWTGPCAAHFAAEEMYHRHQWRCRESPSARNNETLLTLTNATAFNTLANPNPDYPYDNIQPHLFCRFILEAPHTVLLVVPIRTSSRMHASPATSCFAFSIFSRIATVLNYCRVHDEFPFGLGRWCRCTICCGCGWGGLANKLGEYSVDYRRIPKFGFRMVVTRS